MKELIKKIFNSKTFKRATINMLYTNPRLTAAEYLRLSKIVREMDNDTNKEMQTKVQIKKAS